MEFLRLMMNPVFRHSPHRAMRTQVGTLIFVKTRGFYGMYRVSGASTSCDRLWILVSCWDHLPVVTIISKGKEASQIINSFFHFPFLSYLFLATLCLLLAREKRWLEQQMAKMSLRTSGLCRIRKFLRCDREFLNLCLKVDLSPCTSD